LFQSFDYQIPFDLVHLLFDWFRRCHLSPCLFQRRQLPCCSVPLLCGYLLFRLYWPGSHSASLRFLPGERRVRLPFHQDAPRARDVMQEPARSSAAGVRLYVGPMLTEPEERGEESGPRAENTE
jgi:hypothetical protein